MKTIAVTLLLLLACTNCAVAEGNETLDNAVAWLVSKQDKSGAFKSEHYGAMKQGAAMTSLALYSLSMTPEETRTEHAECIEKAFEFLLQGTKERGRVANPDGSLDHPVYSTAMFLVAANRFEKELDRDLVRTLLLYLVDSQCAEGRGFEPKNPNYGGWDVIGPNVMAGKTSGTNVSVTRFVLEAFACWVPDWEMVNRATADRINESQAKALQWLTRLQKSSGGDGGFHFTAQPGSALNKARTKKGIPKSYSSATCDAYTSLNFFGRWGGKTGEWIARNCKDSKVSGFDDTDESGWPAALNFYHLQSLSRVHHIGAFFYPTEFILEDTEKVQTKFEAEIVAVLAASQKDDGRFENESALMREDDPLIATSFAIIALSFSMKQ